MSKHTYEYKDSNRKYEKYEWDETWIENTLDTSATRVLYIGDSISCNVRHLATLHSEGCFLFDGFGTSKALDNNFFLKSLDLFASQLLKTDIVIFNNGLHGFHLSDSDQYRHYYEVMIKFLIERFPNIPLYIVLTTFVNDESRIKRVEERNIVASSIAKKYTLPVIDLYSITEKNKNLLSYDKIHFTQAGNELIAKEIVKSLKANQI